MAPLPHREATPLGRSPYYAFICWESILPAVATFTVTLRIYLRRRFGIALGWDDLTIVAAVPFAWASWATFYYIYSIISPQGLDHIRPQDGPLFSKVMFANIEVSITAVNLVKFSIIIFFMRAFATTRNTRIVLWIILVINVLYGIARTFSIFLLCSPISNFWDNPAACTGDQYVSWISISLIGVVLEFVMLIFPLPFIWKLHMPPMRKVGISALFAVAGGVVLVCAIRVWYFFQATDFSQKISRDHSASILHLMQELENNLGILVACLPAMHSPLRKLLNNWMGRDEQEGHSPTVIVPPIRRTSSFPVGLTLVMTEGTAIGNCSERSPSAALTDHKVSEPMSKIHVTIETTEKTS